MTKRIRRIVLAVLFAAVLPWQAVRAQLVQPARAPTEIVQQAKRAVFQVKVRGANGATVLGTGFLVSADGLAVTNFHVIEGAAGADAEFPELHVTVPAELVCVDAGLDLAILRLPIASGQLKDRVESLKPRTTATVEGLEVWALGFPRLGFTVTRGIVSGMRRYDELPEKLRLGLKYDHSSRWVQTDCTINAGNSGGPLIDAQGQLVGVNTWVWLREANCYFALSGAHVQDLVRRAPTTPIGFRDPVVRGARVLAHHTLPGLQVPSTGSAQSVISASNAARRACICASCNGRGKRFVMVDRGGTGDMIRAPAPEEVVCLKCNGSGDGPEAASVRSLSDLALAIATLDPKDPRGESALEFAKRTLVTVAGGRPDRLAVKINDRAVTQLTDLKIHPGTPVILIGRLASDAGGSDSATRIQVVQLLNKSLSVGLIEPRIVDATEGESVLVLAILAGRVSADDGSLLPILTAGSVIGPDETRAVPNP